MEKSFEFSGRKVFDTENYLSENSVSTEVFVLRILWEYFLRSNKLTTKESVKKFWRNLFVGSND